MKKEYRLVATCVAILLVSTFLLIACNSKKQDEILLSETVKITSGTIKGLRDSISKVLVFKGIPYAAPPVKGLRWKAPQPILPWKEIKKTTDFGSNAIQKILKNRKDVSLEYLIPENSPINEDCLYLNIWTPAKFTTDKLPVVFWIHGGGFDKGSGSVPIYNGESMAEKGIIFVSINYRLGNFGFLAHPALTEESINNSSGNYGLLDQLATLKWVNRNIGSFGGDPNNITIEGQSAGAISVMCLMASPLSMGLFAKAIIQSGVFGIPLVSEINLKKAEAIGIDYAQSLDVNNIKDLRNLPDKEIQNANLPYRQINDGYLLNEKLLDVFLKGKEHKVPLLVGWNADETAAIRAFTEGITLTDYVILSKEKYQEDIDEFLSLYPVSSNQEATNSQIISSGDQVFRAPMRMLAKLHSKTGTPVFLYNFNRKVPVYSGMPNYGANK